MPFTRMTPARTAAFLPIALACVLAPALAACASAAPQASPWLTMGSTPEEQADALMATVLEPALPGCSAAVAHHGTLAWADAVGSADLASGAPLTPATGFDWASNSKHITGMAILTLVADGTVSLDEPVATYLPNAGPWASTTTVAELLHHTSGLPDYVTTLLNRGVAIADSVTQAQALATLDGIHAATPLPQPWAYSNSNYIVLASIVEAVSGEPFADFVEHRLFETVGSDLVVEPLAKYPDIAERYHVRTATSPALSVGWDVVGDGAVMGTPTSMAEWFDVIRTGLPDDPTIAGAMVADAVAVPGTASVTYGAGVFIAPDGSVFHSGEWEGDVSYLAISADRSTTLAIACDFDVQGSQIPTVFRGLAEIWFGPAA